MVDGYALTASEYRINSEKQAKTYDDENGVQVPVKNGQTVTVSLDNYYRKSGEASIDIQKSVWALSKADIINDKWHHKLNDFIF